MPRGISVLLAKWLHLILFLLFGPLAAMNLQNTVCNGLRFLLQIPSFI
jgi:hypothetical protein